MSETATAPPAARGHGLTTGLRMDWAEFERRWTELPEVKRAELIHGVVRMPSPLSQAHGDADSYLNGVLIRYVTDTDGTRHTQNATLRLDARNATQPDAILRFDRRPPDERLTPRVVDYAELPVELVVEVSVSSATRDTEVKRELYHSFRIREYLNWRVFDGAIDWLVWRPDGYAPLVPDAGGVIWSETFPGLWLDIPALIRGDRRALARAIDAGLATAEHAAFVERLRTEDGV